VTLGQAASSGAKAKVGNFFAQGSCKVDLMVLLLHEDLPNLFRHRIFSKRFALPHAIAIIADGIVFILEIEAEYVDGIF
jgi:hypothetical protein